MKIQNASTQFQTSIVKWLNKNPFFGIGLLLIVMVVISSFKPEEGLVNSKIGVINLEYVVAKSSAGMELQQRLESFQKKIQSEAEALTEEARAIRQKIVDGSNSLSESKIAELQKQYEDKQITIRRFQDDKQREGEKMRNEGLREIEMQMEPAVNALVEQLGVDLLLNQAPGVVIWTNGTVDYTEKLIEIMNN